MHADSKVRTYGVWRHESRVEFGEDDDGAVSWTTGRWARTFTRKNTEEDGAGDGEIERGLRVLGQ